MYMEPLIMLSKSKACTNKEKIGKLHPCSYILLCSHFFVIREVSSSLKNRFAFRNPNYNTNHLLSFHNARPKFWWT